MEDGAFGLGSALIYPPGNYAGTEELVEIAKAMAPYGGIYITHMRSEADKVLEGMDEALRIGREGGVPVEIYHLKAAGVKNWSKEPAMIAKIDSAPHASRRDSMPRGRSSGTSPIRRCARRSERSSPTRRATGRASASRPRQKACCSRRCARRRISAGRATGCRRSPPGRGRIGSTR
jgi:hypothetical protein